MFDVDARISADGTVGPFPVEGGGLVEGSERVTVDGRLLARDVDYRVTDGGTTVTFLEPPARGAKIVLRGRTGEQVYEQTFRRRAMPDEARGRIFSDDLQGTDERRPATRPRWDDETGLRVSGTKRVQVSLGSTGEPSLTQSLRVDLSGEIAPNVTVRAVLSDRNLPVGTYGSTRSLETLDRVFFQVQSPTLRAGLGDLDVHFNETTFGRYDRRLQGADVAWETGDATVTAFGAVTEGRWLSRRILTREGYQGPYQLGVEGGFGRIVAGSERIHLDGAPLRRGEAQDYTIDYDRGAVRFMPNRPIHGDSRVTVTYQAHDGTDGLRMMGVRGRTFVGGERLRIGSTYLQESGRGLARDAPDAAIGTRRLSVVDATFAAESGFSATGEMALSGATDTTGSGTAMRVRLDSGERALAIGEQGLGRVQVEAGYREIGDTFTPMDRVQQVREEGAWGWRSERALLTGRVADVRLGYVPVTGLRVRADYGRRTGAMDASRDAVQVTLDGRTRVSAGYANVRQEDGLFATREIEAASDLGVARPRLRYRDETATGTGTLSSSLRYADPFTGSAPDEAGLGVREAVFDLATPESRRAAWGSSVSYRQTRRKDAVWTDSTRTMSHQHRLRFSGPQGLSVLGEASRSRVIGPGAPLGGMTTHLARVRFSAAPAGGAVTQQVSYRISSTGAAADDPLYLFVGEGRGAFLWEDVDGDGVQDAEEFFPDPAGDYDAFQRPAQGYTPVREAALGAQIGVDMRRVIRDPTGAWGKALSGLAADVWFEADRQARPAGESVAPWTLGRFADDESVVTARREVRSAVDFLRAARDWTLRLENRFVDRLDRGLSEDGRVDEVTASVLARWRIGRDVDLEARVEDASREREGEGPFAHTIDSRSGALRSLFRIGRTWQTGMTLGLGRDTEANRDIQANRFSIGPELRRSFIGRGRITGSADWTRVTSDTRLPLFLGLADGNRTGDNLRWRLGLDYRLADYVTAYLTYDGRKQPERNALHYGRVEVRANF